MARMLSEASSMKFTRLFKSSESVRSKMQIGKALDRAADWSTAMVRNPC